MKYASQRELVVNTGVAMIDSALAVGTWGNISCRVAGEFLLITPSGMEYRDITPRDILLMDLQGVVVEGNRKPSTEHPLHRWIYRSRPDVRAIVHTHSVYASALACARQAIPAAVEDLVQIVGGAVAVTAYALPGSDALGQEAARALADRDGALLANHGAVGVGPNLNHALKVCSIMEKAARITIAAQAVGGVVELEQSDIDGMRDFFLHSYGQNKGGG